MGYLLWKSHLVGTHLESALVLSLGKIVPAEAAAADTYWGFRTRKVGEHSIVEQLSEDGWRYSEILRLMTDRRAVCRAVL